MRSVSQRLEGIEDGVDRLDERLAGLQSSLDGLTKELAEQRKALAKGPATRAPAKRTPPAT